MIAAATLWVVTLALWLHGSAAYDAIGAVTAGAALRRLESHASHIRLLWGRVPTSATVYSDGSFSSFDKTAAYSTWPVWLEWLGLRAYRFRAASWGVISIDEHDGWLMAFWTLAILGLLPRKIWPVRCRGRGLCPTCGYDLRGTPARCPECGLVVAEAGR